MLSIADCRKWRKATNFAAS